MIEPLGAIVGCFGIWLCFCDISNKLIPYCLVSGIVLLCVGSALAHDHSRPELNDWFNKLASGKGLCCSFADGTAISDVDWETKNGKYRVRIDNEWIDVPQDAVITEPNRAGRTMVWPMKGYLGTSIRCFMPGSMI